MCTTLHQSVLLSLFVDGLELDLQFEFSFFEVPFCTGAFLAEFLVFDPGFLVDIFVSYYDLLLVR